MEKFGLPVGPRLLVVSLLCCRCSTANNSTFIPCVLRPLSTYLLLSSSSAISSNPFCRRHSPWKISMFYSYCTSSKFNSAWGATMVYWPVERMFFGHVSIAYTGCTILNGILLASEKRRCTYDTFWPVKEVSLKMWKHAAPEKTIELVPALTHRRKIGEGSITSSVTHSSKHIVTQMGCKNSSKM